MDRRIKVWLTVLIVLLIAAIVAVLGINSQLSGSKEALEATSTQLASELEKIEQLTADYEDVSAQLTEAQAMNEQYAGDEQAAQETIAAMEAAAAEYEVRIAELEDAIAEGQAQIEVLAVPAEAEVETAETDVAVVDEAETAGETEGSAVETTEVEVPESEPVEVVIPEVEVPAVEASELLENATKVDVEEIYADIDSIINAADGEMTDEEKVAALDTLKEQLGVYVEELNAALDEISKHEDALAESVDNIDLLESELVAAQENVNTLNAAISDSKNTIAELQAQVDVLSAQNESDSAEAQAQIDALNAEIAAEQEKVNALTEELAAAKAQLEKQLAELEVYKLERELAAGDAHTAATLEETLTVAADGKTVAWAYTNDTISGNAVVLSIQLDGEELYVSETLQPGESLPGFELNRVLEAGEYEAVAVASVCDADGNFVSSTRVPVKIQVG